MKRKLFLLPPHGFCHLTKAPRGEKQYLTPPPLTDAVKEWAKKIQNVKRIGAPKEHGWLGFDTICKTPFINGDVLRLVLAETRVSSTLNVTLFFFISVNKTRLLRSSPQYFFSLLQGEKTGTKTHIKSGAGAP